jgi:hypothetical protein
LLIGGIGEESATPEDLYGEFTSELDSDTEISPPRRIDVDGKPGVEADISGSVEGEDVAGRLVVVAVTPTHHFIMIGLAPADRWDDKVAPLFDAVLASVRFFPPAGAEEPLPGEETRQWAVYATASSEYGDPDWSAMQTTGAPDTPECGDYTTAWASESYGTVEWIELDYDTPVLPTKVNIVQTYNPNQVVKVELRDVDGEYHTVYTGEPEDRSGDCPFVLHIVVEDADYLADGILITIDQSVIEDWNEIDAVELVGIP